LVRNFRTHFQIMFSIFINLKVSVQLHNWWRHSTGTEKKQKDYGALALLTDQPPPMHLLIWLKQSKISRLSSLPSSQPSIGVQKKAFYVMNHFTVCDSTSQMQQSTQIQHTIAATKSLQQLVGSSEHAST